MLRSVYRGLQTCTALSPVDGRLVRGGVTLRRRFCCSGGAGLLVQQTCAVTEVAEPSTAPLGQSGAPGRAGHSGRRRHAQVRGGAARLCLQCERVRGHVQDCGRGGQRQTGSQHGQGQHGLGLVRGGPVRQEVGVGSERSARSEWSAAGDVTPHGLTGRPLGSSGCLGVSGIPRNFERQ